MNLHQSEGNLREAEHHYCEAGEWLSAVNMYRSNNMWDEAIRVAKIYGGVNASKRVAYAWALALGGEAGAKLLTKLGLIDPAIDYDMESGVSEQTTTSNGQFGCYDMTSLNCDYYYYYYYYGFSFPS